MQMRLIRYYVTVCDTMNFTRASERLHVSQPTITVAMHQLEEELGVVLFDRRGKTFELTHAGEYFYEQAKVMLTQMDSIVARTRTIAAEHPLHVRIGIPPMIGFQLGSMLLHHMTGDLSDLKLTITTGGSVDSFERLKQNELDLAWVMDISIPDGLQYLQLETQEWLLYVSDSHPLAQHKQPVALELFKNENFLIMSLPSEKTSTPQLMEKYCKQVGFMPCGGESYIPVHPAELESLVRRGMGISFRPNRSIVPLPGVAYLHTEPAIRCGVGLAWRKCSPLSEGVRRLIQFIQKNYPE